MSFCAAGPPLCTTTVFVTFTVDHTLYVLCDLCASVVVIPRRPESRLHQPRCRLPAQTPVATRQRLARRLGVRHSLRPRPGQLSVRPGKRAISLRRAALFRVSCEQEQRCCASEAHRGNVEDPRLGSALVVTEQPCRSSNSLVDRNSMASSSMRVCSQKRSRRSHTGKGSSHSFHERGLPRPRVQRILRGPAVPSISRMPYWSVRIHTRLSVHAANERIHALVKPSWPLWKKIGETFEAPRDDRPFEGKVSDRAFEVMRVIHYRNTFLPVILGAIEGAPGGAIVRLHMRLHAFGFIFMIVWFSMVASGLSATSWQELRDLEAHVIVPLGMLAFGVLLIAAGFFPEALKTAKLFRKALE